jgi:hypothetical protein
MKKALLLLIPLLFLTGCSQRGMVIPEKVERYCPMPVRPELLPPKTIPELLINYNRLATYALELESLATCYQGGKNNEGISETGIQQ